MFENILLIISGIVVGATLSLIIFLKALDKQKKQATLELQKDYQKMRSNTMLRDALSQCRKLLDEQSRDYAARHIGFEKELNRLAELEEKYIWQVRDTCARAEKTERENKKLREALENPTSRFNIDAKAELERE